MGRSALIAAALLCACQRERAGIRADRVAAPAPCATSSSSDAAPTVARPTGEDLGTDDGVSRAFEAATGTHCATLAGCLCVHRAKAFPDLVVVGVEHAPRRCKLEGFFFRRAWYDALGPDPRTVLAELGWDAASRTRRVDLAMAWAREVTFRFDGLVDTRPAGFVDPRAPRFHPLEATWEPSGAIEVRAFVSEETPTLTAYHEETVRFDPLGHVSKTAIGAFWAVPVK